MTVPPAPLVVIDAPTNTISGGRRHSAPRTVSAPYRTYAMALGYAHVPCVNRQPFLPRTGVYRRQQPPSPQRLLVSLSSLQQWCFARHRVATVASAVRRLPMRTFVPNREQLEVLRVAGVPEPGVMLIRVSAGSVFSDRQLH